MSIKDITDYVRLTPGNTNPSVIGSMVQSEVNGTLKDSKAYTDQEVGNLKNSGGAGYTKKYTASFLVPNPMDGIEYDTTLLGIGFIWFSAEAPTKADFSNWDVTGTSPKNESFTSKVSVTDDNILSENEMGYVFDADGIYIMVAFSAGETEAGTIPKTGMYYAFSNLNNMYACRGYTYTFEKEIIHPIDQKFIPGAVLPFIELTTAISDTGPTHFEGEEKAKLVSVAKTGMPAIIKLTVKYDGEFEDPITAVFINGADASFMCVYADLLINIMATNDMCAGVVQRMTTATAAEVSE